MSRRSLHPIASRRTDDGINREFLKVPNAVVDALMRCVLGSQFKAFMYIWRSAIGFQRQEFSLSLNELARKAGMGRDTARDALRFWERAGLFRKAGKTDQRGATTFQFAAIGDILSGLTRLVEKSRQSDFPAKPGRKNRFPLAGWFDPYKDNNEKQVNTYTHGNGFPNAGTSIPGDSLQVLHLPDGASIPDPDPWELAKKQLREEIDPRTYDTWIRPTRLAYALNGILHIRVPSRDWDYMQEQYGTEIDEAIKALNLPYSKLVLMPMQST